MALPESTTRERKVQTLHRLSPEQYRALEKQLLPPHTTNDDTMLTAGVRLGIQQVLKLLREGYVTGDI